jgi:hypothetical protein
VRASTFLTVWRRLRGGRLDAGFAASATRGPPSPITATLFSTAEIVALMVASNMSTDAASHRIFLAEKGEAESEKPPGSVAGLPLGTLNQVIVALGKTIRAMADGTLDSQVGARICNGLGIMHACLG